MAQASKGWNLVAPIASFAVVFAALTMCSAQSQSPVEYDNSGHLVPATLPHMYRYAFRAVHDLEEATKGQGPGKSARPGLRYELGLSEADFEIFEDSAIRFGQRDKDIRKQIAAIAKADWPRHPGNWVLSQKARTQVHALLAKGEDDLANELVTLKAGLSPQSAVALDARVTRLYTITLVVPPGAGNRSPQSANPAQPKTPAQQRNSSSPSSADQPGQPAATETCPTCPVPTGNNMLNFSPDGTTVNANFYYEIPQADADAGCIPSGVFSIDSGGAAVATDNVDGAGGAVLDDTVSTTVSVGSTYNPAGSVQSCDALGTCSTPTLIVGTGFPTGAPAITAISPSSASLGQSGNTTLTGTLLGGPPGDVPTVSVTSGTGLDLETTQPATYGTGDTGASTQIVEYTVDSNATVGSDTFQLNTVWGSTTHAFSVTCALPSIYNISPTPWTTGTKYNITISGYGFCTGSTIKITVATGSVTITSPVVVNDQTMTATVQPTNTTAETATVTVTNSSGTSNGYQVSIQAANVGPLYLVDPYLLSGYSSGTITTSTVLGTLPGNADNARGLIADGTSTAIVALQVPTSTTSTTFSVSAGSVAAYSTTFLATAPSTGSTSINVTPVANGSSYYALALVQAPTSATVSSITVTAKTSSGSTTGSLTLYKPAVLLVHGLWGNQNALGGVQSSLLSAGYSATFLIPICYSSTIPWNASSGGTGNCQQNSATAIGNALTNSTSGAYSQYDAMHIAGGRVDYVGHSMGGLAARYYSSLSTYLTNVRDRHQGAIHTFITLDMPAQGSLLANYLISNAQCTVQKNSWYHFENSILSSANCNNTMTLQQCMAAAGIPLAANGAAVTSGAVYSLEPAYINAVTYPGKPTNSTWIATSASFPDTASPGSFLRDILQRLMANFYGTANQPAGAPCNTTAAPQTFTQILGNVANDVIVTTVSQRAGASQAPNVTVTDAGNLEHTKTPADGFGATMLEILLNDTDTNILSSTGVDTTIQTYLKTP